MLMAFIRYVTAALLWMTAIGSAGAGALAIMLAIECTTRREDIPFSLAVALVGLVMLAVCVGLAFLGCRIVQ